MQREWDEAILRELAERYAVSREVILRRLLILGRTTEAFYERKRAEYRQQFLEMRERAREAGGFAPYPRLVVRDNGRRYTRLVLDALDRDQITAADVTDYLGVSLRHLAEIAEAAATRGVTGAARHLSLVPAIYRWQSHDDARQSGVPRSGPRT